MHMYGNVRGKDPYGRKLFINDVRVKKSSLMNYYLLFPRSSRQAMSQS